MAENDENKSGVEVPQEYIDMLENKTVSAEMLDAACYTYNKVAKNYRDEGDPQGRDECYAKKDSLLAAAEPICIHKETYEYACETHASTDPDYEDFKPYFDSERTFQNKETGETVSIGVIERKKEISEPRYYLFYDFGGKHTYHHPLWHGPSYDESRLYPVKEIDVLHMHGADINTLLPESFCDKVVDLVKSGDFTFVPADDVFEKILMHEDAINERNAESREKDFEFMGGDAGQTDKFNVESRAEQFDSLPEDMKAAINESGLPYRIENMILDNSDYFTADDVKGASEIEATADLKWESDKVDCYERITDFLEERYNLNYADAVSRDHGFDEEQEKIVEGYGHEGTGFSESVSTLLDIGMSGKEIDAILTDGNNNIIFSPDQSVVIADAYRDGMDEKQINVLKEACGMKHEADGEMLQKISDCLSRGGDAGTVSEMLPAIDRLSTTESMPVNTDRFLIPAVEGAVDPKLINHAAYVLSSGDYFSERDGDRLFNGRSAGDLVNDFLSNGNSMEELVQTVDHIDEKIGMPDDAGLYLDAYGRGVDAELIEDCMDGDADHRALENIMGMERNGMDAEFLKDHILDESGMIDSMAVSDLEKASEAGMDLKQMDALLSIHEQYNPGWYAREEIILAIQDGISPDDIKSYIGMICEASDKPGFYDDEQDYAMACCRIELENGNGIDEVMDNLGTWLNDERCTSDYHNFDEIVGYDYDGKEQCRELPDKYMYVHDSWDYYEDMSHETDKTEDDYVNYENEDWYDDYSEPVWRNSDWKEITEGKQDESDKVDDAAKEALESILKSIDAGMSEYSEAAQDVDKENADAIETDEDAVISEENEEEKSFEYEYDPVG